MDEQLGMNKRKVKRGANFVMSEELFNDMLAKYLGFEPDTLQVWHVTSEHYMRAYEISVVTEDERFPEIPEGARFPKLTPIVDSVKVSDDPIRFEAKFKGFMEIEQ